jgi:protein TonB
LQVAIFASAAAHVLLLAGWLAVGLLEGGELPPQVPAEVELVLGGGGQSPGEPEPVETPPAEAQAPPSPDAAEPDPKPVPPTPPPDAAAQDDGVPAPTPPPPAPAASPPAVRVGDSFLGMAADLVANDGRFRAAQGKDGNLPPPYPRAAGASRQQGQVLARMHVDPDGRVVEVEVLKSSGSALLDRSAREALAKWRFTPAFRDGAAVADQVDLNINFRLD